MYRQPLLLEEIQRQVKLTMKKNRESVPEVERSFVFKLFFSEQGLQ